MQLKEIPGLQFTKDQLITSHKNNKLSHALLFHGPQGNSALPLALAYCQYLACEDPQTDDSCGQCPSCKKFSHHNFPDLHWSFPVANLDSKKKYISDDFIRSWQAMVQENPYFSFTDWLAKIGAEKKQGFISVYESASLIKKINLKSHSGGRKFIVMWLPEKLNGNAANKILKSLEEPTSATLFILVSHQPEQLLQTITSRCQKVHIPHHTEEETVQYLQSRMALSATQAEEVAAVAKGNFTEAAKIALDSERFTEYASLFRDWMRACFKANVKGIFDFTEQFSKLEKEKQKEALVFYLEAIQLSFNHNLREQDLSHPLFQKAQFKLDSFKPFIHSQNAPQIYTLFEDAIRDITRNGNSRLIISDISLRISRFLRIKAS